MQKETQESGGKDVIYPRLSLNLARLVNGVSAFVQYKMRRVVKMRIFIDVDEWFQKWLVSSNFFKTPSIIYYWSSAKFHTIEVSNTVLQISGHVLKCHCQFVLIQLYKQKIKIKLRIVLPCKAVALNMSHCMLHWIRLLYATISRH